jgi:hypothetical protein
MVSFPYRHIIVIGSTGCGKSWLAEKLAQKLDLTFIELDALYWKPGWVESGEEEFRCKVDIATRSPGWALAGNYSKVRDLIWPRADVVIWLDYPFLVVFGRLWSRTWRRWWTKELLWGSNYERLFPQFKFWSNESLFHWLVKSYGRHKHLYPQLFSRPEHAHLHVFRFKNQYETNEWLALL